MTRKVSDIGQKKQFLIAWGHYSFSLISHNCCFTLKNVEQSLMFSVLSYFRIIKSR